MADKMTPASAVELLRKHMSISWENREAIAALIEGMEAQAAAMRWVLRESIEQSDRRNNDGHPRVGDVNVLYKKAKEVIHSTTAGADLLAVVKAAEEVFRKTSLVRCKPEMCSNCNEDKARIGCRLQVLGQALAAYRGGGR